MNEGYDILEDVLPHVNPAALDYTEWIAVGMALKEGGYTAWDWEIWSEPDPRHKPGECFAKWNSFHGAANPVTLGTVVQMAKDQGWQPEKREKDDYAIGWDDAIGGKDELVIIDKTWIEEREIAEPDHWEPVSEISRYLETLFEAGENVGYVTECWEKDDSDGRTRYLPTKGLCDRTAGQLIEELTLCDGDIGAVFGDYRPEAGAWIRFNPLDGKGVKNENVTDFRYALVESDDMSIARQNAMIRELELPVACLVYSGGKSLHAIVRIEAATYDEYRKRVDYLYGVLKKNGFSIDSQNKNPSRLSRMPGVTRNGKKQFIVDTNIGKSDWNEWREWIEGVNDDLPDPETLADCWDRMPPLSPPLIDGVLRQGHKMLLAGPSKAGKSYALIELAIAIAEGRPWLGFQCAAGRVLYVNLELDRASCLHRFRDVYEALGWEAKAKGCIDVWNLRGNSVPMDKLAPKLIRRAAKKDYIAVIIDPIYKVITGDENSADQMAHFCNQFDKVCTELNCAVIYCHHHSKGTQGQKRSMDRASGSGVFARDPDALLDYIELEITPELLKQEENKAVCAVCEKWLNRHVPGWLDEIGLDDALSETTLLPAADRLLGQELYRKMLQEIYAGRVKARRRSAWRIEGTLREFEKFPPLNFWFDYPVHRVDEDGALQDLEAEGMTPLIKGQKKAREKAKKQSETKRKTVIEAIENCNGGEPPTVDQLMESLTGQLTWGRRHLLRQLKEFGYRLEETEHNVFLILKNEENQNE